MPNSTRSGRPLPISWLLWASPWGHRFNFEQMASLSNEDACQHSEGLSLNDLESLPNLRSRSASVSSTGSSGRVQLRHRVAQLMACVEDISSDDEIHEEVSRTLDEAFLRWGKKLKDKWQEFRFCSLQLVVFVVVSGLTNRFLIDEEWQKFYGEIRTFLGLGAYPHFNFSQKKKMFGFLFVFRLHLVTWNVGTASPPPDVTSLLQLNSLGPTTDMYVIGWVYIKELALWVYCKTAGSQCGLFWEDCVMWITPWEMV